MQVLNEIQAIGSRIQETAAQQFPRDDSLEKKVDEMVRYQIMLSKKLDDLVGELNVSHYY